MIIQWFFPILNIQLGWMRRVLQDRADVCHEKKRGWHGSAGVWTIFLGFFLALRKIKQLLEMPWCIAWCSWRNPGCSSNSHQWISTCFTSGNKIIPLGCWQDGLWWLSVENARTLLREYFSRKDAFVRIAAPCRAQLIHSGCSAESRSSGKFTAPGVPHLSHYQSGDGQEGVFLFLQNICVTPAFALLWCREIHQVLPLWAMIKNLTCKELEFLSCCFLAVPWFVVWSMRSYFLSKEQDLMNLSYFQPCVITESEDGLDCKGH